MTIESIHHVPNCEGVAQPAAQVERNEHENRADPISPGTVNGISRRRVRFNLVVQENEEKDEEIRFLKRKLVRLRAALQSNENEGKQGLVSMVGGRRYLRQEPGGPSSNQQVLKSCLKRKASSDDDSSEKREQLNNDDDEEGDADDAEELSEDEFEELYEEDVEECARALETRNQLKLAAVATFVNHSQGWDDIMSAQQRWIYEEPEYREQQEQWFFQQNLIICVLLLVLMALLEQRQQLLCA